MSVKVLASLCGVGVLLGLLGCSQDVAPGAAPSEEDDLTKSAVSTFECTVSKGVDAHDDVAKFSFKATGVGTSKTTFVKDAWKVSDKSGHSLESDGEHMSVVAEGFANGVDIKQCRKDATKGLLCGTLVASLDNEGSEMPVSISLTKKSNYKHGTLTIDNTINTGDNSGFLHAPIDCTINGK
jgi:hypothetical protein